MMRARVERRRATEAAESLTSIFRRSITSELFAPLSGREHAVDERSRL